MLRQNYTVVLLMFVLTASTVFAGTMPFSTSLSDDYLIIATERVGTNTDLATNNFELGANKAPVPANTDFLDSGGGPTLEGAVPPLPSNILPVFSGISGDGNLIVTDPTGEFNLQDVGVYADPQIGIRLAGGMSSNASGNSYFNDPNMFPNTYDPMTGTGVDVNPGDADQSTLIDQPNNAGITFNYDASLLISELNMSATAISALPSTGTLDTGGDGKISSDTVFTLSSGLNVIDIDTGGGNDFLIENSNFVIDGPADAFAIFRLPGNDNMNISNSNVLIGDSGLGLNNVLFFTDQNEDDGHFNFSNTIINGAAFWSLGANGGSISISNAQGCTQLVADIVELDDVRFTRCHYAIPEPSSLMLLGVGVVGLLPRRR